ARHAPGERRCAPARRDAPGRHRCADRRIAPHPAAAAAPRRALSWRRACRLPDHRGIGRRTERVGGRVCLIISAKVVADAAAMMDDTPPNTTVPRRRLAAPRRGHGKVWLGLGLAAWVLGAVGWALWLTLPERPASTAVTWPSRITVTRYPVVPPQASPPPGNAAPQAAHEPVVEESAEMTRPDPGSAAPPPPASAPPAPPPEIAAVTVAAPALAPSAKPGKGAPPPWL